MNKHQQNKQTHGPRRERNGARHPRLYPERRTRPTTGLNPRRRGETQGVFIESVTCHITSRTIARSSSYTSKSGRTRRKPPCTGNAFELGVAMAGSVVYSRLASDSIGFGHLNDGVSGKHHADLLLGGYGNLLRGIFLCESTSGGRPQRGGILRFLDTTPGEVSKNHPPDT